MDRVGLREGECGQFQMRIVVLRAKSNTEMLYIRILRSGNPYLEVVFVFGFKFSIGFRKKFRK